MEIGNEFNRIEKYFKPLTEKLSGAFALLDDAAELHIPSDRQVVITTDTIVEGIHFIGTEKPASIARKLLGVNLSDLAAKGAFPHSYSLSLGIPKSIQDDWLEDFVSGLQVMQDQYDIALSGGDSVTVPHGIVLSVTAIGLVLNRKGMIRRDKARVGNGLYITGTIGDGALGLLAAQGKVSSNYLADRYFHPQPRIDFIPLLREYATAAMDVSDGLIADTAKLMRASQLSAQINLDNVPFSSETLELIKQDEEYRDIALTGGDDYEILFTATKGYHEKLMARAQELGLTITRIGVVEKQGDDLVSVLDQENNKLSFQKLGYSHT